MRRKIQKTCRLCSDVALSLGLCSMHYQRHYRGSELDGPRQTKQPAPANGLCTHPGCTNKHDAKGLCGMHYQRRRAAAAVAARKPCVECGARTASVDAEGDPVCKRCQRELSTPARRAA